MDNNDKSLSDISALLANGYNKDEIVAMDIKVRQHNEFVAAPYAVDLTSHEIKLIEYMISLVKVIDKDLINAKVHKEFVFSATDLAKVLNTHISRVVKDADKLADSITSKKIIEKRLDIRGNIEDFSYIPIVSYANYNKGLFKFSLNYYVLKYFVDINQNFTEFQLRYLLSLTTAYSVKLYKLLLQYKNIGYRAFELAELKEQFGVADKYPQFGNFKQKIIEPSINYINKQTDISVEYKEIKIGRRVEKLEFKFKLKEKNKNNTVIDIPLIEDSLNVPEIELLLESFNNKVSDKTKQLLSNILTEKGNLYVLASIEYAKKNAKSNFDKYLFDTLTNNWAELDIQKLNTKREKQETNQKNLQEKEEEREKIQLLENANRSEIEHLFLKLTEIEQSKYVELANSIFHKHSDKLHKMHCNENLLAYSVFAVSEGRYYNKALEIYISKMLNKSLNINDYLV